MSIHVVIKDVTFELNAYTYKVVFKVQFNSCLPHGVYPSEDLAVLAAFAVSIVAIQFKVYPVGCRSFSKCGAVRITLAEVFRQLIY